MFESNSYFPDTEASHVKKQRRTCYITPTRRIPIKTTQDALFTIEQEDIPFMLELVEISYVERILIDWLGDITIFTIDPTFIDLYRILIGDLDESNDKWIRAGTIQVLISSDCEELSMEWPKTVPQCRDILSAWAYESLPFSHYREKMNGFLYTRQIIYEKYKVEVPFGILFERVGNIFYQLFPYSFEHQVELAGPYMFDSHPYYPVPDFFDHNIMGTEGVMFLGAEAEYRLKKRPSYEKQVGEMVREIDCFDNPLYYRLKQSTSAELIKRIYRADALYGRRFEIVRGPQVFHNDNGTKSIGSYLYSGDQQIVPENEVSKVLVFAGLKVAMVMEGSRLTLPGGRLKPGETPRAALNRELLEEIPDVQLSGIRYHSFQDLQYTDEAFLPNDPSRTWRVHCFVASLSKGRLNYYDQDYQASRMILRITQYPKNVVPDKKSTQVTTDTSGILWRVFKKDKVAFFKSKIENNNNLLLKVPKVFRRTHLSVQVLDKVWHFSFVAEMDCYEPYLDISFFGLGVGSDHKYLLYRRVENKEVQVNNLVEEFPFPPQDVKFMQEGQELEVEFVEKLHRNGGEKWTVYFKCPKVKMKWKEKARDSDIRG